MKTQSVGQLNIRKIALKDKAEFMNMSTQFYDTEAVLCLVDEDKHLKAFEELMRSDTYLDCYMIESDDQIIGYALLNKTYCREAGGPVIWIEEVFVKPEYQGQGVGSYFFQWMDENLYATRYRLEVEPDNIGGKELYQRLGYKSFAYVQMIKE